VFGSLLNPTQGGESALQTLRVVDEEGGRWLAMAVMYFFASLTLTLGLPALLTLFERRGRRLGLVGIGVFTVGAIGTSGYAMVMVFFRAMVQAGAVKATAVNDVSHDTSLLGFLYVWIAGFYLGVLLIAAGLLLSRTSPRWVPGLLVLFVAMLPVAGRLGHVGMAVQTLALAVAFTGVATAAVTGDYQRTLRSEPAY
jgi:hypothetical protein